MSYLLWLCLFSLGDGDLEEVAAGLESRSAATRRVAVRALGELGTPRAWERILPHLSEEDGEVADEAQW